MWSASLRGETHSDKDGMLTAFNLQGSGATLNVEYKPTTTSYLRIEGRYLTLDSEKNKVFFDKSNVPTNSRLEAMFNFGVAF
jgi:hypothetical protein